MISADDGSIQFESPAFRITCATTRDEFLASPLSALATPAEQSGPWANYSLQSITGGDEPFSCNLSFQYGRIASVVFVSVREEFGASRRDGFEEKTLAAKKFHETFLQNEFCCPPFVVFPHMDRRYSLMGYNFSWGHVRSFISPDSTSSGIEITYTHHTPATVKA